VPFDALEPPTTLDDEPDFFMGCCSLDDDASTRDAGGGRTWVRPRACARHVRLLEQQDRGMCNRASGVCAKCAGNSRKQACARLLIPTVNSFLECSACDAAPGDAGEGSVSGTNNMTRSSACVALARCKRAAILQHIILVEQRPFSVNPRSYFMEASGESFVGSSRDALKCDLLGADVLGVCPCTYPMFTISL